MINISYIKKVFFITTSFFVMMLLISCKKEVVSVNDNVLEQTYSEEKSEKKIDFTSSSLQDCSLLCIEDDILTTMYDGLIFYIKSEDGKYQFQETLNNYFYPEVDNAFAPTKIFEYEKKVIFVGVYINDIGIAYKAIIHNMENNQNSVIELASNSSDTYFINGNKLYYDQYLLDSDRDIIGYRVMYLDLDTEKSKVVCEYEQPLDRAYFVVREDNGIALYITDSEEMVRILTYENDIFTEVACKKWLRLIDYDMRGAFYTEPSLPMDKLKNLNEDFLAGKYNFVLQNENGEKIILMQEDGKVSTYLKLYIFDNFFLYINDQDDLETPCVEQYDFNGKLQKRYNLTRWPNPGRAVVSESRVAYYDGKLYNMFYRNDTQELNVQTIFIN